MAAPTAQEQYFLELVNRARLNPLAEAQRYGIDLNQGLAAGTITASQKQPLAWSLLLSESAAGHSSWMLNTDIFSHTGINGTTPHQRMQTAGYSFTGSWASGENIAFVGTTGAININSSISQLHQNLFLSSGHRENILSPYYREVGISAVTGVYTSGGTNYNSVMATQNFALSGNNKFVTGVAYTDTDADGYYSIGEGNGSVTATLTAAGAVLSQMAAWTTGGYNTSTASSGLMQLTFSGAGLAGAMGAQFTLGSDNIKIDLVNGNTIESSASVQLLGAAVNLELLGINDTYGYGNSLANMMTGNSGSNVLAGFDGTDTLYGQDGNDILMGGTGADVLYGGNGSDYAFYSSASSGVVVYLSAGGGYAGEAAGDIVYGIENLWGSGYDDFLVGDAIANIIVGAGGNDFLVGNAGGDYLDGGAGSDYVYYANAASAVTVYLSYNAGYTGDAAGDTLVGIENVWGSAFADFISGSAETNFILADAGNDILVGGAAADYLDGGTGADTAYYASATSAVSVNLQAGSGSAGEAAGDVLLNIENLWGSAFGDQLTGNALSNMIVGGGGNDVLAGGVGNDIFYYGVGANGADTISDFASSADHIYFALAAAANFGALTITGNGTNSVTVSYAAGSIVVQGTSPMTLTAGDFIFA